MIRRCDGGDFEAILAVINAAARAYEGVIPADRWHQPYMPAAELKREIDAGVAFWGYDEDGPPPEVVRRAGRLGGVMGIQPVADVTLIRHAYVAPARQRRGIGGALLARVRAEITGPILIGTWAAADWAIRFYQKHGFRLVPAEATPGLLGRYWSIPARQVATSVVLADSTWFARRGPGA